jgi:hypothetical protein
VRVPVIVPRKPDDTSGAAWLIQTQTQTQVWRGNAQCC